MLKKLLRLYWTINYIQNYAKGVMQVKFRSKYLLDVDIHNYYWVWYNFVYVSSKWNHIIYDMWGYVFSSLSFIA